MLRNVASCRVMSHYVTLFHVISRHVTSCHVMSRHVTSCHMMYLMSRHGTSCHVMSYHVMSCHVMSRLAPSCHVMSYHVTSYHIESRGTVTRPTLHCQLTSSTRNQFKLSNTVFVGCPEGCRYNTASAVYDLVLIIILISSSSSLRAEILSLRPTLKNARCSLFLPPTDGKSQNLVSPFLPHQIPMFLLSMKFG